MAHDQPTYASVPGIRVFGMMCVKPGYSVRRPPAQPPKRYQLQKPYYRPTTIGDAMQNSYVSGGGGYGQDKDTYGRPGSTISNSNTGNYHNLHEHYQQQQQQNQHQSNYQYLNRPESGSSNNNYRPDGLQMNQLPSGSIYGRNNERQDEKPIEATGEEDQPKIFLQTSTPTSDEARTTIDNNNVNINNNIPAMPQFNGETSESPSTAALSAATVTAAIAETAAPNSQSEENTAHVERQKRAAIISDNFANINDLDDDTPEFPWDRVIEFQQSIIWN